MPGLDEFELIERFFNRPKADPAVEIGIGDDAAVIHAEGRLALATDTLVGGIHFPPELEPRAIGHRALAVNLSDLAAMGAEPRWALLALTLPSAEADWLEAFAAGFFALADRYGVALIGGDSTRGPLSVTVELIGTVPTPPLRRGAGQAGDEVWVTGTLGDAAGGLAALAGAATGSSAEALVHRFAYPEPRVAFGVALASVAHAAIDVSDGLVADLGHICEASGLGVEIDVARLPLSPALAGSAAPERARDYALTGGDDYELCFTAAAADGERIERLAADRSTPVTRIGRLTSARGVRCLLDGQPVPLAAAGFRHF